MSDPLLRPYPVPGMLSGMSEREDAGTRMRLSAWVHGQVQGVGFRWWTRSRALELGLNGYARNSADGRVHVVAEGSRANCDRLLALLRSGTTPGRVDLVVESWETPRGDVTGFEER